MSDSLADARARLKARQVALAEYLADPTVEARFRAAPDDEAQTRSIPAAYARWLGALDPARVAAFRRTQDKKRSEGRGPGAGERAAP